MINRVFQSLLVVASFFSISATSASSNDITTHTLTFTGTNCSIDGRKTFVEQIIGGKTNLKYTIQVDEGYASPTDDDVECNVPFHINKSIITFTNPITTNIDLKIDVETPYQKEFDFSFNGTGCSINGKTEISAKIENGKEDVRYTILPDQGKKMPTIEVSEGEDLLDYDMSTGVLVISKMTGNVALTATSIDAPVTDSISFSGLNCKATGHGFDSKMFTFKAEKDEDYDFIITPDNGYELPTSIDVEIDGEPATSGSDYTYEVKEDEKYHLSFTLEGTTLIYIKATEPINTYKVTFNSKGGSAVPAIENINRGDFIDEPTAPTLAGKIFDGWFLDDKTFKQRFNFEETAIIDNLTLYARWATDGVTVTLDAGRSGFVEITDGDRYYSFTVPKGSTWGDLSQSLFGGAKHNYNFLYWTLNGTMISENTVINSPVELEAVYKPMSTEYLAFTPRKDNVTLHAARTLYGSFSYMIEGESWVDVGMEDISVTVSRGTRIYLKGTIETIPENFFGGTTHFEVSGPCKAMTSSDAVTFAYMFADSNIISAYNLIFPSNLVDKSFYSMFRFCAYLKIVSPILPATILTKECYSSMFQGCSSLLNAPELPATTLTEKCYSSMFNGCSSLAVAPALPATNLASTCYSSMFVDCSSLAVAPALPATNLASTCYSSMFLGCSSLINAPELPATTLTKECYISMFKECSSLAVAPALPATNLASNCYASMFSGCSSLINAPELPAAKLTQSCYASMFYRCSSLVDTPKLLADKLESTCYYRMFYDCKKLKINRDERGVEFFECPADISPSQCVYEMFVGTGGDFKGTPTAKTTYYYE